MSLLVHVVQIGEGDGAPRELRHDLSLSRNGSRCQVRELTRLGLPAILAYATILAEIAGGAALVLGVFTRIVAVATIPVLVG